MHREQRAMRRPGAMLLNLAALGILAVFSPAWIYVILTSYTVDAYTIAGAGIVAIASVLLAIARVQLNVAFTANERAQVLVTTGLYARFRHPIYLFNLLLLFGVILTLKRYDGMFLWMLLFLLQLMRARSEETRLEEAFGHDYIVYKTNTWF